MNKMEIDKLTTEFFQLFVTKPNEIISLNKIFDLCIPEAIIIKNVDNNPEVSSLSEFVAPREKLLNSGTLVDFFEEEVSEDTQIFGKIAHRFLSYRKSGKLNAISFDSKGWKTIQFIKTQEGWKISSVAWDDE